MKATLKHANFDGSDCCPSPSNIRDGVCDLENNIALCNYDGGDCCIPVHYGSGYCETLNNNRMCEFDLGDCCMGTISYIGDGICHDENNNGQCGFDGGDCCLPQVNTTACLACECIGKEVIQPYDPCPEYQMIANGVCNEENNNLICKFDGGDCLVPNVYEGFCPKYAQIGDGICQDENNIDLCLYDGGDCCLSELDTSQCTECSCLSNSTGYDPCPEGHKIGDGTCDLSNNNTVCSFDGGDCSR